jgi:hypothetical protein
LLQEPASWHESLTNHAFVEQRALERVKTLNSAVGPALKNMQHAAEINKIIEKFSQVAISHGLQIRNDDVTKTFLSGRWRALIGRTIAQDAPMIKIEISLEGAYAASFNGGVPVGCKDLPQLLVLVEGMCKRLSR